MTFRLTSALVAIIGVSLVSACGGDDTKGTTNTPSLAVALSPSTATVTRGSSTTISVALTRQSLDGVAVALAVTGAPTGVTTTFDSASTTNSTATLTVAATLDATLGPASLTLTATADSGESDSATVALTVGDIAPITVAGTLVNGFGIGYAGAIVHVYGQDATTPVDATTAADGTFTAANVRPPYDVVAVIPAGNRVFLGMTSATPVIGTILDSSMPTGTVEQTGSIALVSGSTAVTAVEVFTPNGGGSTVTSSGDTTYSLDVNPPLTGTSVNATVRALQYEADSHGNPTSYLGYEETAASLSTTASTAVNLAPAGPIASHTLSLQITTAPGSTPSQASLVWLASDHTAPNLATAQSLTNPVTFVAPGDARIPLITSITAVDALGSGALVFNTVGTTTTSLQVTVPPGATNLSPANGAIGVNDTSTLSIDAIEGSTYTFILANKASPSTDNVSIVSAVPSVPVARLRAIGVPLTAGATYAYQVAAFFGGGSDPFAKNRLLVVELAKIDNSGYRATAAGSTFAVQP